MQKWKPSIEQSENETTAAAAVVAAAAAAAADPESDFFRGLLFFADPNSTEDVVLVAHACRATLRSNAPPSLCTPHPVVEPAASILKLRAARLTALSLACLSLHTDTLLQPHLSHRPAALDQREAMSVENEMLEGTAADDDDDVVVLPLIEAVGRLTHTDSWKGSSGGVEGAGDTVAYIIAPLLQQQQRRWQSGSGLFEQVAVILDAACPFISGTDALMNDGNDGGDDDDRRAAAQALCVSLIQQYFTVKSRIRIDVAINSSAGTTGHTRSSSQPAAVLCVPGLFQRCPSLKRFSLVLWRSAVEHQYKFTFEQFQQWLPVCVTRQGAAGSAAALLGNLTDIFRALVSSSSSSGGGGEHENRNTVTQNECLGFLNIATKLLLLIPTRYLPAASAAQQSSSGGGENNEWLDGDGHQEDDEERAALAAAVTSAAVGTEGGASAAQITPLRLPLLQDFSSGSIATAVASQIARLCQPTVITGICKSIFATSTITSTTSSSLTGNESKALATQAAAARQACAFFALLMQLPGQKKKVLLSLALKADFVQRLWYSFLRPAHEMSVASGSGVLGGFLIQRPSSSSSSSSSSSTTTTPPMHQQNQCDPGWMLPLWIFSEAATIAIQVQGDSGLYSRGQPLPLTELYSEQHPCGALSLLRSALWHILWQEAATATTVNHPPGGASSPTTAAAAAALRSRVSLTVGRLMAQLHERNGRRAFAPPSAFYAENLPPERFHSEVSSGLASGWDQEDYEGSRAWTLLAHAPFLVPFLERAKVFQRLVASERVGYRNREGGAFGGGGGGGHRQFITVQRGQVLSDAFEQLGSATIEELRGRVRIAFVSEMGTEEAGVDGGGIFKEFLEEVVKEGFDPGAGLFSQTTDRRLYPNPHAVYTVPGALRLLEFLGKMIGKALWEGILVELPLAPFFLKKVRGGTPSDVDDLPTLDPQLARSLESLKDYQGDVADLGLTFSLTEKILDKTQEVDLIQGGRDIPITSSNAAEFIHRVAHYKLNTQLRAPVAAFMKGLHSIIRPAWIGMFNDRELQELISGAEGGAVLDIDDLRRYVQYAGGYSADHPVVAALFQVLASFTPAQCAEFLKFVTSCPRPPLLGLAYLEPPLCIQMATGEDTGRLPTAATCMNLLKLPPYTDAKQIREKLLYAIESGAGFELS